jgi:hypothetical protein
MKNLSIINILSFLVCLVSLSSCRTDQPLFAGAVYLGGFFVIFGILGIIFVIKKIL